MNSMEELIRIIGELANKVGGLQEQMIAQREN
jgi:hypothetical protein